MKVAQLTTRYPPGPGGVERHVAELAPRLAARGHTVDVFTSELYREYPWERLPTSVPREERTEFGSVHRLPVWSLPGELHYPFFRGLDAALDRLRPQVVHVHTYGTHQASVARRFGRRTQTPFVITAHFHPIWSIEGGWLRHRLRGFYDRRIGGGVVGAAARVVVQTREEERLLRAAGISLPAVEVIPPGLTPLPPANPAVDSVERRFGLHGPFVLFVGRLASNKGLLTLVDAFAPLARRDPGSVLVLAGADGGMAAAVEARAEDRGIADRVRRLGHIEDDAVLAQLYRAARLTVLPSEYEAFGLVLLESLAEGTPVVASRVGGIPEVVEDGRAGILVPPGAVAQLGDAIERLWADPALGRRLGEYGRREVVPRYLWENVAARLDGVYREVVGG